MNLTLTGASISYLCQCVASIAITAYFLSRPQKQTSTWLLAGFMASMASFASTSFAESIAPPFWRFQIFVWQPITILAALIALLQFVYYFPTFTPAYKNEAKLVLIISILIFLLSVLRAIYRLIQIEYNILEDSDSVIDISPIAIGLLWSIIVLLRRTIHFHKSEINADTGSITTHFIALYHPQGKSAQATRAYALSLSIPLWVTVVLLIEDIWSLEFAEAFLTKITGFSWQGYLDFAILFVGLLAFSLSFLITYLNHSPDPSSFMAKIVGISLGTVLLIMGIVGLNLAFLFPNSYQNEALLVNQSIRFEPAQAGGYYIEAIPFSFDTDLGQPINLTHNSAVLELPFTFAFYDHAWQEIHIHEDGAIAFGQAFNPGLFRFKINSVPAIVPLIFKLSPDTFGDNQLFYKGTAEQMIITWHKLRESGDSLQNENTFQLTLYATGAFDITYKELHAHEIYYDDNHRRAHLIGVLSGDSTLLPEQIRFGESLPYHAIHSGGIIEDYYADFRQALHTQLSPLAFMIIISSLFILIGFPRFFHINLVKPMNALVMGITEINHGNLESRVAVSYNDEIGFMASSFNQMVESLNRSERHKNELNRALKQSNEELIQRVQERKQAEDALRDSEERFRIIAEASPVALTVIRKSDGAMLYTNARFDTMFGYSRENPFTGKVADLYYDPADYQRLLQKIAEEDTVRNYEVRTKRVDGTPFWSAIFTDSMIFDGVEASYAAAQDVTARKQAELKLKTSLQEKEVLLKEIHHRVKNNLQVISSLLDLQSGYVEDEYIREIFLETRTRVRSMAFVHEQLYQAADLARINFADYIEQLSRYLSQSYQHYTGQVRVQLELSPLMLSVETAVPLGLIINELVSNAYKHAFVDGRSGQITITMHTTAPHCHLIIQDNGIGLPNTIDFHHSPSLGLTIVNTLVEQLQGQVEVNRQNGTRFDLLFVISDEASTFVETF